MSGHIHPAFACVFDRIADAPLLLGEIQRKTEAEREQQRQDAADVAARFGEGFSLFGGDERDEEAELQADQRQDLIRRSA